MKRIGELNPVLQKEPYLYRIELLDRFFKMLDRKELIMVRPTCWSDPLENIIFNATLLKQGKPFHHPAKENVYGQCWSYEGDSYALWQIYTTKPNDRGETKRHLGVRITTHLSRLKQISDLNKGQFYCGLVDYLYKKELDQLHKNKEFVLGLGKLDLDHTHLKTLLVKRRSYDYEKEFRLLTVPDRSHVDRRKNFLCRLHIEPTDFISSVRLDPAMDAEQFKKVKEKLVDKYGFRPSQVTQSSLGRSNRLVFRLPDAE